MGSVDGKPRETGPSVLRHEGNERIGPKSTDRDLWLGGLALDTTNW